MGDQSQTGLSVSAGPGLGSVAGEASDDSLAGANVIRRHPTVVKGGKTESPGTQGLQFTRPSSRVQFKGWQHSNFGDYIEYEMAVQ